MMRQMPKPAERAALDAVFLVLGLILSYVESFIPMSAIVPVPGVKLGFASLAVMCAVCCTGYTDALAVMVGRVTLSALLFGTPVSFIYSFAGGLLSFFALIISKKLLNKQKISYIGMSIFSASAHNAGQILAACLLLGEFSFAYYLSFLLFSSIITGSLTGIIMHNLSKVLKLKNA